MLPTTGLGIQAARKQALVAGMVRRFTALLDATRRLLPGIRGRPAPAAAKVSRPVSLLKTMVLNSKMRFLLAACISVRTMNSLGPSAKGFASTACFPTCRPKVGRSHAHPNSASAAPVSSCLFGICRGVTIRAPFRVVHLPAEHAAEEPWKADARTRSGRQHNGSVPRQGCNAGSLASDLICAAVQESGRDGRRTHVLPPPIYTTAG